MARIRELLAGAVLGLGLAAGAAAAAQDADTPLDKALQQVEALLQGLRAEKGTDPKVLERLEEIAANLRRAKGEPARPGDAPPGPGGGGGGAPAPGVADWIMKQTKDSFLKGVELKDADRSVAEDVIVEFVTDYNVAKTHDDEKSKAVIRDHTEKRIARSFPAREGNRMKDNLDGIIKFWEGRWGRGGR